MSRWYRAYADAHRNPKVAALSDKDFRLWHRLLSVAAENDGVIPPLDQLKRLLSMRLDYLKGGVERLLKAELVDALKVGYEPHNWSKRQYKSDSSVERVRKHRAKTAVTVTPPETETETETDTPPTPLGGEPDLFGDENPPVGEQAINGEKYTGAFEQFWSAYPNKTGKGKAAAAYEKAFKRLGGAKTGTARVHEFLLVSIKAQCVVWKRKGVGGQYIPHAATWLNQRRYDDPAVAKQRHADLGQPGQQIPAPPSELAPAAPKAKGKPKLAPVGWSPDDEDR